MYQKYPLAIILLYYEVATEQVWQRQQREFRNLLSECCDYFVSRHGKLNLIVNTTEKIGAKNFCTIPAMEPCISGEFFAGWMQMRCSALYWRSRSRKSDSGIAKASE